MGGVLAAVLLAAGCTGDEEPRIGTPPEQAASQLAACPAPGEPATVPTALPDLELPCLGGGPAVSLRRLTGTPTVVNLWASWCPPCREELPALSRLQADAAGKVRVVGIASLDTTANSAAYAEGGALPFPSLEDRTGDLGKALRRRGLPVTLFLAADGTLAHTYQGPPLTDATLRTLVRDELGVDV